MSTSNYIALSRKWRPKTFSMLVGQNHVTSVLSQALDKKKLHHAYLFTGTQGVGKTSIARIFAKGLSCEQQLSSTPCLTCDHCVGIDHGTFIDLIEIDAASKTRIEDTRELLDSVSYAPTVGRFKIYLIDEVHMLSQHSFNALLKTLEEPPAHVKFLLATTDPQKLPATILSRCLQFHLKPLSQSCIQQELHHILTQEHIAYEEKATLLIAKAAQGSMRDALSLVEQAISLEHATLTCTQVQAQLGLCQEDYTSAVLAALIRKKPEDLIQISRAILDSGASYHHVLSTILHDLHQIHLQQLLPPDPLIASAAPLLKALSLCFSTEQIQLLYDIALKGTQDLSLAPSPVIAFEMLLLRMYTFAPVPLVLPTTPPLEWDEIVPSLKLSGMAKAAIEHTVLVEDELPILHLSATEAHRSLFSTQVILNIETALSSYFEQPIKIELIFQERLLDHSPAQKKQIYKHQLEEETLRKLTQDPIFKTIEHLFSAKIIEGSVEPIKNSL